MKTQHSLLLLLTFVLAFGSAESLAIWKAKRQYALNRQLIAALVSHDHKAALALVNRGADPNTRQEAIRVPTLPQVLRLLRHHSLPIVNHSPTAFHLACGGILTELTLEGIKASQLPDDVPLVQAMLVHGADVRSTNEDRETALLWAILWNHPHTAQVLLDNGANVNALDANDMTPLMVAAEGNKAEMVRLLLEHGASTTQTDHSRNAALECPMQNYANPRIVGMLLAHGADPNARNTDGEPPLHIAQQRDLSDLVRLMRGGR